MQNTPSSSSDAGNSSLTGQERALPPDAVGRILFYVVLGAAFGLAALEIELSTGLEAVQSESEPPPASQSERNQR